MRPQAQRKWPLLVLLGFSENDTTDEGDEVQGTVQLKQQHIIFLAGLNHAQRVGADTKGKPRSTKYFWHSRIAGEHMRPFSFTSCKIQVQ